MSESKQKPEMHTLEAIHAAAGELSTAEQAKLILMLEQGLADSHSWFATPEIAQAWREEIAYRIKAIDEGKATLLDGDKVLRDLREKYAP
jgi:hypothetical protein